MVRINLIDPKYLTDQHLIAEYGEILYLLGHVRKYPQVEFMPPRYCLGAGHINFFKDKLNYLDKRFNVVKIEMIKRGFSPKLRLSLKGYPKTLKNDWNPCKDDLKIIKKRLIYKIKLKPNWYRYHKEHKSLKFYLELTKKAKLIHL